MQQVSKGKPVKKGEVSETAKQTDTGPTFSN